MENDDTIINRKGKKYSQADIQQLFKLWNDHTVEEIAVIMGRSKASIMTFSSLIRKAGFPLKSRRRIETTSMRIRNALGSLAAEQLNRD